MTPGLGEFLLSGNVRVKDANKAFIFDLVLYGDECSRKKILDIYHLRPTVLTNAVRELLEDGLVIERKVCSTKSGRPELRLIPEPNRLLAISVYSESRHFKFALVNLKGCILHETSEELRKEAGPEEFLELCGRQIRSLLTCVPDTSTLAGIGMSMPGRVDSGNRRWLATYRWPAIKNLDLSILESEFGCIVSVKKDLDSLLEYNIRKSPELCVGNTLLFHWGFGVGFAYAQDGVNHNSGRQRFGEIGHTIIDLRNRKSCICGSVGCIETDSAIWALLPKLQDLDPTLSDDEHALADFCTAHHEIIDLPSIRTALSTVTLSFMNIYRLFFPTHALLLGPFFAVPAVSRSFRERIIKETTALSSAAIDFHNISDGYHGCIFANARSIFSIKLDTLLRAKF